MNSTPAVHVDAGVEPVRHDDASIGRPQCRENLSFFERLPNGGWSDFARNAKAGMFTPQMAPRIAHAREERRHAELAYERARKQPPAVGGVCASTHATRKLVHNKSENEAASSANSALDRP